MEQHRQTDAAVNFLGIAKDQLEIMQGALDLRTTTCGDACVPLDDVFMMSNQEKLSQGTLADILAKGFSRIPVYNGSKHNVCGLLLVKRLIVIDPADERVIETLLTRKPSVVGLNTTLLDALNEFQGGRSHMAIVCNRPDVVRQCISEGKEIPVSTHMAGIITIEDAIERIIKEPIDDETQPDRMDSLNNPFTHYTEAGAAFKMKRLARIKSIAAAFKRAATKKVHDRTAVRKGEGYVRLDSNSIGATDVEEGGGDTEEVEKPDSASVRRVSRSLQKIMSQENVKGREQKEESTLGAIANDTNNAMTPLLQKL